MALCFFLLFFITVLPVKGLVSVFTDLANTLRFGVYFCVCVSYCSVDTILSRNIVTILCCYIKFLDLFLLEVVFDFLS